MAIRFKPETASVVPVVTISSWVVAVAGIVYLAPINEFVADLRRFAAKRFFDTGNERPQCAQKIIKARSDIGFNKQVGPPSGKLGSGDFILERGDIGLPALPS
jgi:hypothetical protein